MRTLLFLCLPLFIYADITLKELMDSPKGHVRNFNIWQYMSTDISAAQADTAYALVDGYNHKIFTRYAKVTEDKTIKEQYRCSKLTVNSLFNETNATCINLRLDLRTALKLNKTQRSHILKLLKKEYPNKSELLGLMNSNNFILDVLNSGEKNYIELFNSLGNKNRQKYFNVKVPQERINALAEEKGFERSVKYIVTDSKMHRMQESLLLLEPHEFNATTYFFLGLNSLRFKATQKAIFYFEIAQKKAYYQIDKDKALFWKYLVSGDPSVLKELTLSTDINIYTLYANEKYGLNIGNYFTEQSLQKRPSNINLQDPYVWEETLAKIRQADEQELNTMLEEYSSKDDDVLHAFIYSKAVKYKEHNYIMPYKIATQELSNDDKALLYALARQESHFIPSAISRSYALGVMQMMPFLIKALAKQNKEEADLNEMFDPEKNISYAKKHLLYLQKHLYHPLFIAYAYNGGIGFTRRHLGKGTFRKGSYEPFLSMELMANTESREYGKKVLANYVVYKQILNEEVKITSLFETLTDPAHTDHFRR